MTLRGPHQLPDLRDITTCFCKKMLQNLQLSCKNLSTLTIVLQRTVEYDSFLQDNSRPGSDSSVLKQLLDGFDAIVGYNRRVLFDSVDFFDSLADLIEAKSRQILENFIQDPMGSTNEPSARLTTEQFQRVSPIIKDAVNPTQLVLARNQISDIAARQGIDKYFDDFMTSKAQQNFFYGMLKNSERFKRRKGDNLQMLTVGIPQGFSTNVLGIDPVLNADTFNQRRKFKIFLMKV